MSTESSWDSARWRDGGHHQHYDRSRAPPLSAPTAVNPASQSSILDRYSLEARSSKSTSRVFSERRLSEQYSLAEPYTDAATYPSRHHARHSPAPGGDYGPQQLANTSPHQPLTGAWRGLHHDKHRPSTTQPTDAPLTLHIPQGQDVPRLTPAYTGVKSEGQPFQRSIPTPSQSALSLPSFASFQEHASRQDDPDVDGPEIAPMASRLSCSLCTKLKPMVHEVAVAVAELDENVQSYCNKAVTRTLDIPNDSPARAVQWILDRLRYAKRDMQDAARRSHQPAAYFFPHPPAPTTGVVSRSASPYSSLKRQAAWDDCPITKRPKSGESPDETSRTMMAASSYHDDRRASIDYLPRNAYSPQQIDSASLSAYPRGGSPAPPGRSLRPLPSPSSLAYPPSAAPSLPPPTVHPGSPAPSFPASASIHTASTSSATSAHIADLQHQVTLKSLALQTLQSEYSGLLQKLQREKVKSQTIEKKTTVSEQEVNDLTGKNEELTEQVKSLEVQMEESERKRETERLDAAREKEQWGRMLDMGGRLQAKLGIDRQNLTEERDALRKRVAALENQRKGQSPHVADGADRVHAQLLDDPSSQTPTESSGNAPSEMAGLKREIAALKVTIETLTSALQEARRHNNELNETSKKLVKHSGEIDNVIGKVLAHNDGDTSKDAFGERTSTKLTATTNGLPAPQKAVPSNGTPPVLTSTPRSPPKLAHVTNTGHGGGKPPLPTPTSATRPSISEMANAGRAVSPGPEELGIHVQPTTSSPEELIKALGPVPGTAPLPPFRFTAGAAPFTGSSGQETYAAQRSSRSPPSTQSSNFERLAVGNTDGRTYFHSSPYGQVPSPYAGQYRHYRANEASPASSHSSPGSAKDESPTSSTLARRRSPETPGHNDSRRPLEHANPLRRFPEMVTAAHTGLASFRQWDHDTKHGDATVAMPPPPRPYSAAQTIGFGQTSGS